MKIGQFMQIITSVSQLNDSTEAIKECVSQLNISTIPPSIILCYFTENYNSKKILDYLKEQFPNSKIHGCTSCKGVMTDDGFSSHSSLGLWVLTDVKGSYGTGILELPSESHDISQLTKQVLNQAIADSTRYGELPSLILLHATPGYEEKIIETIDAFFGTPVPLIGGSAADDYAKGNWSIFTQQGATNQGISISVFYPTCKVSYSFHSGYANSGISGIATKTNGRTIYEIDNKPVIDVYKEWTEIPMQIGDTKNLLERVTQYPLGRVAGTMYSVPYFKLAHPVKFTHDGGMECFAKINEGEELFLMIGDTEQIISRPKRVIDSAISMKNDKFEPVGGINIFCAGSMMHINMYMSDVCQSLNDAMHNTSYICPFTFGEQGRFTGGENAHGNLMVSAVLFHY
ncbi:FIST signal transduction protein [Aliivibrio sp. SR45-2]|uniref:FIST signal transduction protein n=1 Tax=Aliivibrio sp. SR45-2 TaxID=2760931 RepID=UPI002102D297|nr:FIST N-terminal domain-containing protein [Aliivibrio sp. SR45-2]